MTNFGLGKLFFYPLQQGQSGHPQHFDVGKHNIGRSLQDADQNLLAVAPRTGQCDIGTGRCDLIRQVLKDQRLILCDKNLDHTIPSFSGCGPEIITLQPTSLLTTEKSTFPLKTISRRAKIFFNPSPPMSAKRCPGPCHPPFYIARQIRRVPQFCPRRIRIHCQ